MGRGCTPVEIQNAALSITKCLPITHRSILKDVEINGEVLRNIEA